jgi:hypothetical protein
MKRADTNHWWAFASLAVLGNIVPPVVWLKADPVYMWTATILVTMATLYAAYRLTAGRRWWVTGIVSSPFVVGPLLIGVAFILAVTGILPVP